ncbi:MAG: TadE/TadG family type IV pilus assembly protein [Terracidiphilus sp.]
MKNVSSDVFEMGTSDRSAQESGKSFSGMPVKVVLLLARLRSALCARNEGSALVEMAVVLPVMMVLITGTCSLGLVLNDYLVLTNAVQSGAMQVAVSAGQSGLDPCNVAATAISGAAPTLGATNITYSFNFSGAPSGQTGQGPFKGTTASTCTTYNAYLSANSSFTVTAKYPIQMFIFGWSPQSFSLQTQSVQMVQ